MDVQPPLVDYPTDPEAMQAVELIIGRDGIAATHGPIEQPSGLPNICFTSNEWFALERHRIFARGWQFVGATREFSERGAQKPLEIAGEPVLILRGEDDHIRAFHNVCRHRGTLLVAEPCATRSITCPYHGWNYRLDGRLRSRPHFKGANEVERFSNAANPGTDLLAIRCAVWNGCIFIDLSGEAPPLEDWLAPMLARTPDHDFSQIRWIGKHSYHIKANWKLILENYMEGYHVFAAHPRLIAHAPMAVRWSGEWTDHVFYNDYIAPTLTEGRGDGLPHYPNLSDEGRRRGAWLYCLPNFGVEIYADQFTVLVTYPLSPDETYEELHFFVIGDDAAAAPEHAKGRAELMAMWHELNLEDVGIMERLQKGRHSSAFPGSLMSPAWEGPSHELGRKIFRAIVEAR